MSWRQPARREQGGRRVGTGGDRAPGPGKLSASVALLGVSGSAGGCRAWDRQGRSRDGSGRAAGLGGRAPHPGSPASAGASAAATRATAIRC